MDEDDDDDDDVSTTNGSELLAFDDGRDCHHLDTETEGEDHDGDEDGGLEGTNEGGDGLRRGRSIRREERAGSGSPGAGDGAIAGEEQGAVPACESAAANIDSSDRASPAEVGATVPTEGGAGTVSSKAVAPSAASSGPGAVAREQGWSDRELLVGLMQPEDTPVMTAHDVSRSVGGIEVKRGLLLVCRNTVYFVDGFGREPALVRPGAPPLTAAAAAAAASAAATASRSKDPLHGVRRLEKWELGGGAGGIGGVDDDGNTGGAKIQVTLRRKSATEITGAKGAKGSGGLLSGGAEAPGPALTAEQAGGEVGEGCDELEDEVLALGRHGVQRFPMDQVIGGESWREGRI